jgi:hypothetical protein
MLAINDGIQFLPPAALGGEIELKGGSFIRLGTNQPNYLIHAIADAKDNVD